MSELMENYRQAQQQLTSTRENIEKCRCWTSSQPFDKHSMGRLGDGKILGFSSPFLKTSSAIDGLCPSILISFSIVFRLCTTTSVAIQYGFRKFGAKSRFIVAPNFVEIQQHICC